MIKVGIIGSGSMGSGIAQLAATSGHEVYLYDNNPDALKAARQKIDKILKRLVEKDRLSDQEATDILNRISFVDNFYVYNDTGLVIEAIVENMDIKKAVFEQFSEIINDDCILATNTSSLSVSAIASACKNPERVLGIHFFNPAPLMKLVEIIPAIQTHKDTLEEACNIIESWGKTTVVAQDTPGFIVNRVARPFYGEALRILEEGIADIPTIDWAMTSIGGVQDGALHPDGLYR
jgi:3-hydroxybutyryl-CoA dehydrogenase